MLLVVQPNGVIRCLYDEALDLTALGPPVISRGSNVEPDADGRWWADLSPVRGPKLGPYPVRTGALQAERNWLERHCLTERPI